MLSSLSEILSPWASFSFSSSLGFLFTLTSHKYTVHSNKHTDRGIRGLERMVRGEAPYIYRRRGWNNGGMMGGDN